MPTLAEINNLMYLKKLADITVSIIETLKISAIGEYKEEELSFSDTSVLLRFRADAHDSSTGYGRMGVTLRLGSNEVSVWVTVHHLLDVPCNHTPVAYNQTISSKKFKDREIEILTNIFANIKEMEALA